MPDFGGHYSGLPAPAAPAPSACERSRVLPDFGSRYRGLAALPGPLPQERRALRGASRA